MSKKAQKLKAARARAARWPTSRVTATPKHGPESAVQYCAGATPEWLEGDADNDMAMHLAPADHARPRYTPMELDLECDSDGVNVCWPSSSKYEMPLNPESSWSDSESICKMEGDELEANLQELRAEVEALGNCTGFEEIQTTRMFADWKTAEANRTLGYNGHSAWTH
ncbi:hypothetical protein SERLA73DRAFT_70616 [Serpula lacrymans var. lacrymans S7.3]|uniref:Uncharacterized protein n=2 Tax=Serpula lacrymans var. lacrymans TaxID=341189 RepID=F8PPQ9_SERL3|nr:uncharacterized protein SERLADRAFT_406285 [Serpula lacrymans var. lacrymans S7.9]EGO01426.1 hypothetical protein SERLA73DRAFT_70616 [Serpula lacrymans var. lacrymans S7.3]EGO27056.1 hypothetical protein SERLADRAFT_406285 [Serpula lacrymans var. lacrymans S7.9]